MTVRHKLENPYDAFVRVTLNVSNKILTEYILFFHHQDSII